MLSLIGKKSFAGLRVPLVGMVRRRKFRILLPLFSIFALIVIGVGIPLWKRLLHSQGIFDFVEDGSTCKVADSWSSDLVMSTPKPEESLIIKRVTSVGEEIIYKVPSYYRHRILRWKNYLFFGPAYGYSDKDKLVRHNLDTGETTIVYRENDEMRSLNDIQLIDGILFFSVSDYSAGAAIFWLSSPTSVPQKVKYDVKFGADRIDFEHGRYWLKGGKGDACGGVRNYALFNPETKAVTPVATSYGGCVEGEEYIAIDSEDRMIMAYHEVEEGSEDPYKQVYKYVVAIPLDSPADRKFLITKEAMPDGIKGVAYSPEKNKLALAGNDLYLFNLSTLELEKIISFPNDWAGIRIVNWIDDRLCLLEVDSVYDSANGGGNFLVNLVNGLLEEGSDYCGKGGYVGKNQLSQEDEKRKEVELLISRLDLPSNYKAVIEVSP